MKTADNKEEASVAILLCTYQGASFLAHQLDSYLQQTHSRWTLWCSDDGSQDETPSILKDWKTRHPSHPLHLKEGPRRGFAANFLSLACDPSIDAAYYAFSDQDDIWDADKLERALQILADTPAHIPALYCSRVRLIDEHNQVIGLSTLFKKPPSFRNALMQSIGGGNTLVFNDAARRLLCKAGADLPIVTHDWWLYILVTGCGGRVFYDPLPSLSYRQHSQNLVGSNRPWRARWARIKMLWAERFRHWNDAHLLALKRMEDDLTPEARSTLRLFSSARNSGFFNRLRQMLEAGVYRQTLGGNLGILVAILFKKI